MFSATFMSLMLFMLSISRSTAGVYSVSTFGTIFCEEFRSSTHEGSFILATAFFTTRSLCLFWVTRTTLRAWMSLRWKRGRWCTSRRDIYLFVLVEEFGFVFVGWRGGGGKSISQTDVIVRPNEDQREHESTTQRDTNQDNVDVW